MRLLLLCQSANVPSQGLIADDIPERLIATRTCVAAVDSDQFPQRRRISTVPVPTLYINGNRSSHFRPVIDSLRIYRTLLSKRLLAVPLQRYKA